MNRHLVTALTVSSLTISLSAFANKGSSYSNSHSNWAKNWYIGAGINNDAKFTLSAALEDTIDGISETYDSDNNNVGFDVYLGHEVNKHLAVEFGYTYIGNVDFTGKTDGVKLENGTVKQWDLDLVAVGRWALDDYFNLMIKGGVAWYENNQEVTAIATGDTNKEDFSGFALTYGGGVEVAWDQFAVRADYTVIHPADSIENTFYISDLVGLSFIYKFMG